MLETRKKMEAHDQKLEPSIDLLEPITAPNPVEPQSIGNTEETVATDSTIIETNEQGLSPFP